MQQFAGRTGRSYKLFDYYGDKAAERVIVLMGSGAQTAIETVEHLVQTGRKGGRAGGAGSTGRSRWPISSRPFQKP